MSDTAFRNTTIIVEPGIRCTSTKTDGSHRDALIEDCRDFLVVQLRQPISVESRPCAGIAKRRRGVSSAYLSQSAVILPLSILQPSEPSLGIYSSYDNATMSVSFAQLISDVNYVNCTSNFSFSITNQENALFGLQLTNATLGSPCPAAFWGSATEGYSVQPTDPPNAMLLQSTSMTTQNSSASLQFCQSDQATLQSRGLHQLPQSTILTSSSSLTTTVMNEALQRSIDIQPPSVATSTTDSVSRH